MATSAVDDLTWNRQHIEVPISMGEIRLFTMRFRGIRSEPDIFVVPRLQRIGAPTTNLRKTGRRIAYIYSCPLEQRIPRLSLVDRHIRYVSSTYRHFYVSVDGNMRGYLALFNKRTLSTLKRKIRKAEASNHEHVLMKTYAHPDEMDEFFEAALQISEKSYQHALLGKGLPKDRDFREQASKKAAAGLVRGFVLFVEDAPAAYNLCPVRGESSLLYDHTGYAPEFSKYSPGTVLQYKVIESLFNDEKIAYYDLCTGEGRHKELFATDSILCANVLFFPLTPLHLASVSLKASMDQLSSVTSNLLARLGLKDRLKKAVRRS